MPLLKINADGVTPVSERGDPDAIIGRVARDMPRTAPAVVMIHGYTHSPFSPAHDPHSHILSLSPKANGRCLSWPQHLGFGIGNRSEGLAIAFGWNARGTIWQAYEAAGRAGIALSRTIRTIQATRPGPVDIIAHSLGARTALTAATLLPNGALGRVILLSGAEFGHCAARALASPAGQSAAFLNVTSGENILFDLLFQRLMQPPWRRAAALGRGLPSNRPNWLDLRIDCPATRSHLRHLGFHVPAPVRAVCHWSGYMRPGLFPLYRAFLRDRGSLSLTDLAQPVHRHDPRPPATAPVAASCRLHPMV